MKLILWLETGVNDDHTVPEKLEETLSNFPLANEALD